MTEGGARSRAWGRPAHFCGVSESSKPKPLIAGLPLAGGPWPRKAATTKAQLLAGDHLARESMKTAASCELSCESQGYQMHRHVERTLRRRHRRAAVTPARGSGTHIHRDTRPACVDTTVGFQAVGNVSVAASPALEGLVVCDALPRTLHTPGPPVVSSPTHRQGKRRRKDGPRAATPPPPSPGTDRSDKHGTGGAGGEGTEWGTRSEPSSGRLSAAKDPVAYLSMGSGPWTSRCPSGRVPLFGRSLSGEVLSRSPMA